VKVIDRILYKLDDLVRPYVHKILIVIEPMLIEDDYYARVEGREIISNLAKAAGLATMIATMRPDIDNQDEYVRADDGWTNLRRSELDLLDSMELVAHCFLFLLLLFFFFCLP
jgi:hypothetical protein